MTERYLIIDFDGTFVQVESPSELALLCLNGDPHREAIIGEIERLTNAAMEGRISMTENLKKKIELLHAKRSDIDALVRILETKITPSILRNRRFFEANASRIYIVTGGYKEYVVPVVGSFGIAPSHVLANTYRFDESGSTVGLDEENPLSRNDGKAEVVKGLGLDGDIYVIGDGYTDYEVKKNGVAAKFIAFTENVRRDVVVRNADYEARTFDDVLRIVGVQPPEVV